MRVVTGKSLLFETRFPYPVMRPDREIRLKWIQAYERAPRVQIPDSHKFGMAPRGSVCSVTLTTHLPITIRDFVATAGPGQTPVYWALIPGSFILPVRRKNSIGWARKISIYPQPGLIP